MIKRDTKIEPDLYMRLCVKRERERDISNIWRGRGRDSDGEIKRKGESER